MYRFRDIALPTLNPASGLKGVINTRSPARRYLRNLADVAARSKLSAITPIAVPSFLRAPSIALSSTPRAPPETTEYPCFAAESPEILGKSDVILICILRTNNGDPAAPKKHFVATAKQNGRGF